MIITLIKELLTIIRIEITTKITSLKTVSYTHLDVYKRQVDTVTTRVQSSAGVHPWKEECRCGRVVTN